MASICPSNENSTKFLNFWVIQLRPTDKMWRYIWKCAGSRGDRTQVRQGGKNRKLKFYENGIMYILVMLPSYCFARQADSSKRKWKENTYKSGHRLKRFFIHLVWRTLSPLSQLIAIYLYNKEKTCFFVRLSVCLSTFSIFLIIILLIIVIYFRIVSKLFSSEPKLNIAPISL